MGSRPFADWELQKLSQADDCGTIVKVTCTRCRITRYYRPRDLMVLMGNIPTVKVYQKMRCAKCQQTEQMESDTLIPTAEQWLTLKVRRLVEIRYVRKIIWAD